MSTNEWTKTELQTYILLLCANADSVETSEEIDLIKSKVDKSTFDKIYAEFSQDSEDESLDKINEAIHLHEYSNIELAQFRKEMYEIFFSDCSFSMMERNLDKIMDNMLY
ncbi:hypothetical protein ACFO5O_00875 [Geojedonia litorea]|uniref:Tellurite resistance protein TerB n=1 Tax=Geojedonia litorea TaxID=1268269 RepID=A0ABV9MXW7_9FLAO